MREHDSTSNTARRQRRLRRSRPASLIGPTHFRLPRIERADRRIVPRHDMLRCMTASGPGVNDYNAFAEAYVAETESSLVNAHYERPAILALAGEIADLHILDVGCGAGALLADLRQNGATVTGLDASEEMLNLARTRLGPDIDLRHADLREKLPFDDGAFDVVIASLVLHYLEDWSRPLNEIRRVLAPGGRLIASVDHPFQSQTQSDSNDSYHAVRPRFFEWNLGGTSALMMFWHRSLSSMTDAFAAADLQIVSINEPQPDPVAAKLDSELFERLATTPNFLFFELKS